jgi:hypothetical protein
LSIHLDLDATWTKSKKDYALEKPLAKRCIASTQFLVLQSRVLHEHLLVTLYNLFERLFAFLRRCLQIVSVNLVTNGNNVLPALHQQLCF